MSFRSLQSPRMTPDPGSVRGEFSLKPSCSWRGSWVEVMVPKAPALRLPFGDQSCIDAALADALTALAEPIWTIGQRCDIRHTAARDQTPTAAPSHAHVRHAPWRPGERPFARVRRWTR